MILTLRGSSSQDWSIGGDGPIRCVDGLGMVKHVYGVE
jgi:hypothetical protein